VEYDNNSPHPSAASFFDRFHAEN